MLESLSQEFAGFYYQNHGKADYHAAINGTRPGSLVLLCDYKGDVSKMAVTPDFICPECDKLLPQFAVREYSSHFEVVETRTGKTHVMGDGVDALFDAEDKPISPGTAGFREKWEKILNANAAETKEAYFPEERKPIKTRKAVVKKLTKKTGE